MPYVRLSVDFYTDEAVLDVLPIFKHIVQAFFPIKGCFAQEIELKDIYKTKRSQIK